MSTFNYGHKLIPISTKHQSANNRLSCKSYILTTTNQKCIFLLNLKIKLQSGAFEFCQHFLFKSLIQLWSKITLPSSHHAFLSNGELCSSLLNLKLFSFSLMPFKVHCCCCAMRSMSSSVSGFFRKSAIIRTWDCKSYN